MGKITLPSKQEYEFEGEPGSVSDGYHTFDELYEFRMLYNAALFNEWFTQGRYFVHKSERHKRLVLLGLDYTQRYAHNVTMLAGSYCHTSAGGSWCCPILKPKA